MLLYNYYYNSTLKQRCPELYPSSKLIQLLVRFSKIATKISTAIALTELLTSFQTVFCAVTLTNAYLLSAIT